MFSIIVLFYVHAILTAYDIIVMPMEVSHTNLLEADHNCFEVISMLEKSKLSVLEATARSPAFIWEPICDGKQGNNCCKVLA